MIDWHPKMALLIDLLRDREADKLKKTLVGILNGRI